ncbi:MAG: glycosyl transferase [Pelagibacterales bacterium]|nr:glycosyl transferase [Pelagibacterales bacterium]|tara:strand:+ start:13174 stop:13914 length:741 start_codon:yes stop_codon:yes gene_type:complete
MGKISIITICYNAEKTISKTLDSIKNQSYQNYEHIVIDGGSSDKTLELVKKANISIKIISEKDGGIYDAFNKGLKIASGDIIGFLNSDDIFHEKDSLKKILDSFDDDIDCVFGDLIYSNIKNETKRIWKGSKFKKGTFKKGWMPAHPTFYCKRSIYEKYGFFKEEYKIAGDFELMLRFLEKHNIRSKYIPETLVNMKLGGISNRDIGNILIILQEEFKAFKQSNISLNKFFYILHKSKKIKEFKIF